MNLLISLELDGGEVGLGREALLLPSTGTEEKVGMPHHPSPFSSLLGYRNEVKEGLETRSPTCSGVELQPASGIGTTGCRVVGKPRELREHLFPGTSYP